MCRQIAGHSALVSEKCDWLGHSMRALTRPLVRGMTKRNADAKPIWRNAELRRFLKQTIDSVRARGQVDTRRVSLSAVIAGLLLIPGWLFLLRVLVVVAQRIQIPERWSPEPAWRQAS